MPMPIVSPSLFNGHGLFATDNEPHAQPGEHVRVNSHPLLGLPVGPHIVWRGAAVDEQAFELRNDVRFNELLPNGDSGAVLIPVFSMTSNRDVVVKFVREANESVIWARLQADPGVGGLRVDAYVTSPHGPSYIGSRTEPPWSFSGPGLVELRLSGAAGVVGVEWLESHDIPKVSFEAVAALNLPHPGGPRYAGITSPVKTALSRVFHQAPKRLPLQETIGAVPPAAAPLATPDGEQDRVLSLTTTLEEDLDALITDFSASPFEQIATATVPSDDGGDLGTLSTRRLDRVMQSQLDPGTASFIGYKHYQPIEGDERFAVYWIDGWFHAVEPPPPPLGLPAEFLTPAQQSALDFSGRLNGLRAANRFADQNAFLIELRKAISRVPGTVALNPNTLLQLQHHSDYIGLGTLVVVDHLAPLSPVEAPRLVDDSQSGWLPEPAPIARREVRIGIEGVRSGGLLAVEKQTPAAAGVHNSLNRENDQGFHLPLALGANVDDTNLAPVDRPGSGSLTDRTAPDASVRYLLAQQDRFGRWSGWRSRVSQPDVRPKPPRPILEASYAQADPAAGGLPAGAAVSTAPLAGSVRVRVAVPPPDALAPASFLLQSLALDITEVSNGTRVSRTELIADSESPPERLDFTFSGPPLRATEQRKLQLVAHWVDTEGTRSIPSEPFGLTLVDPRAPAQLPAPDELLYSARPDVTGLALIEHEWVPQTGQSTFGVYYTDENRLRAALATVADEDPASLQATVLTQLENAVDAAARATIYRANTSLFGGELFERLDDVVLELTDGRRQFRHAVSGSLRVLNLYRLSAESASNARVDLSTLPLIVFGVPNDDPPAPPVLQVRPVAMASNEDTYAIDASISFVPGVTHAETFRLRRTSIDASDALRMPIVGTGHMQSLDQDGKQRAEATDTGPVLISTTATLKPWVRYQWVAEVQGAFASGSAASGKAVPGLWSKPSAPAELVLVPPLAPAAPMALSISGTAIGGGTLTKITVSFDHRHTLSGGAVGRYTARLQRRRPQERFQTFPDSVISGKGPFQLSGHHPDNDNEEIPTGTVFRLTIIDPLGRESDFAEAVVT